MNLDTELGHTPESAPGRAAHPLTAGVVKLAAETAATAEAMNDLANAELVRAEARRLRDGAAAVVVVGEKKRGKSSLINALIEHPGLLPVDVDVATSVHLDVVYSSPPFARAFMEDAVEPKSIEISEVAAYAALDPETGRIVVPGVRSVHVGVPAPLLRRGLSLVDTPGVGGLMAGHTEITLATLSLADALIFVVDGSSELTASELDFLGRATERVSAVYFALTQIDKFPEWRQVLAKNHELIAARAPRYKDAPWFPVSSLAKEQAVRAAAAGRGEHAADRAAASGFAELEQTLARDVAGRAEELRLTNVVHVVGKVLALLGPVQERLVRSLAGDPTLAAEVERRRSELEALKARDASWRRTLESNFAALEQEIRADVGRRVNQLYTRLDDMVAEGNRELADELPSHLDTGLRGIWMELEIQVRGGIARIAADLSRQFAASNLGEVAVELAFPDRFARLPEMSQRGENVTMEERVRRAGSALRSGSLLGVVTFAVAGGTVLPGVIAAGTAWLFARQAKNQREMARLRGDARRYLNYMITEVRSELPVVVSQALARVATDTAERVAGQIEANQRKLESELAAYNRSLRTEAADRNRKRADAQRDLDVLRALNTSANAYARQLEPPASPS